jgi:putative hemolysin
MTATTLRFDLTWRRFRIRIASTPEEIATALEIRHRVFHLELLGRSAPGGSDADAFDRSCDHLLITDAATDAAIGACRLFASTRGSSCYSATEFDLEPFLSWPGNKVEMGRTCVLQAQRNNLVLAALGRGVNAYCESVGARWLFGCSSIMSSEVALAASLCRVFIAGGHCLPDEVASPRRDRRLAGLDAALAAYDPVLLDEDAIHSLLPPLLRTYLRAGARLSRLPSYDPDFACIDFLTVLDRQRSDAAFMQRYAAMPR